MAFGVFVSGEETFREFSNADERVRRAAVRAVNRTARDTRAEAAQEIIRQVNLPASYVSPREGRLAIIRRATRQRQEAVIRARGRATSLSRFAVGRPGGNRSGITVAVQRGRSVFLPRAFLVRLRRGSITTDTQFNAGLAIRLPEGQRPQGTSRAVELAPGLFLLYGPSVAQIFLDNQNQGVARDLEEPTATALQTEFLRQLALVGL